MRRIFLGLLLASATLGAAHSAPAKPTIVLVHGAFADASSWNRVIALLEKDGYPIVAVANPLRGVKRDAAYVGDILANLKAPVVLVGHSYGGSVISAAAESRSNVKALVYVAAFAPKVGETAAGLAGKFPGSTLGPALAPSVTLSDGGRDLSIRPEKFHAQFAADLPDDEAALMAATQRPITESALSEPQPKAAWSHLPSWFISGDADKNIPPAAIAFMAKRAKAREALVIKGASHVLMISNPEPVARLIEQAAIDH